MWRSGVLAALSAIAISQAQAHGEYDWIREQGFVNPKTGVHCCGPNDCFPLKADQVRAVRGGYEVEGMFWGAPRHYLIPQEEVQQSQDGRIWLCVLEWVPERVHCFFYPSLI